MRRAWCIAVATTSLLVMASTSFAQSFCSDLDQVVTLAPSGFRSIRDDASRGALGTTVTHSLPGASSCWYENVGGAYWCSWGGPSAHVASQVKQLATAVGECYQVPADYDASMAFAFIDLPNSTSVYVNGVGGMVFLSIGDSRFDEGAGRPVEGVRSGDLTPTARRLSQQDNAVRDRASGVSELADRTARREEAFTPVLFAR
jgi:hypothetical protein